MINVSEGYSQRVCRDPQHVCTEPTACLGVPAECLEGTRCGCGCPQRVWRVLAACLEGARSAFQGSSWRLSKGPGSEFLSYPQQSSGVSRERHTKFHVCLDRFSWVACSSLLKIRFGCLGRGLGVRKRQQGLGWEFCNKF